MKGFEDTERQRRAFEDMQSISRENEAHGRADLYDVRLPVVEIDHRDIHAGEGFFAAEGQQLIDGGKHKRGGHFRAVEALQQGYRAFGDTARVFAAAHAVGKGDHKPSFVYLDDGMRVAAGDFAVLVRVATPNAASK